MEQSNSSLNNSDYKYLKYKNKYLRFKQSGGGCDASSYYFYFCFNEVRTSEFIKDSSNYNNYKINDIDHALSLAAIKYNFGNEFNIVIAPGAKVKDDILSFNKINIKEKFDIIKLMSKINLLKLISSLENKYNNKKSDSPSELTQQPVEQTSEQPAEQPSEQATAKPSTQPTAKPSAEQATAKPSTQPASKPSTQSATSVKTGGAISNIKICDVLIFEESNNRKKNDGKIDLIIHWKIENDDIKDVQIDNGDFDITFVDDLQIKDVKKPKSNFFNFVKK